MITSWAVRPLPPVYRPLLRHRPFRRLLLALGASDLGDGLTVVAVAWLAIQLAQRPGSGFAAGTLLAAAVVAYTLPGALGGPLLNRWLRSLPATRLLIADSLVRLVMLGLVPLIWVAGWLHPWVYLALLGASSLLHAWGIAGRYTLVAQMLPPEQRLAGNALLSTSVWVSMVAGPALAGLLVAIVDPAWIIGLDALSFGVLAIAVLRLPGTAVDDAPTSRAEPADTGASGGVWRVLQRHPDLLGLLVVTCLFNLAYGPVKVALPLFVAGDLEGGGGLLGAYWTAFGVGAVAGALATSALRRFPVWPVLLAIIAGHGLGQLPFGLAVPGSTLIIVSMVGFAVAGVVYGPYTALSFTLLQQRSPRAWLAALIALRGAVLLSAGPLGTALGGPLTALASPRQVLVGSGVFMIVLAVVAALWRRATSAGEAGAPDVARGPIPVNDVA